MENMENIAGWAVCQLPISSRNSECKSMFFSLLLEVFVKVFRNGRIS